MAWKKWTNFFNDTSKYFDSDKWHAATPGPQFNSGYYFLMSNFSGYSEDSVEIDMRAVYSQEGALAMTQANLIKQVLVDIRTNAPSNAFLSDLYKKFKENQSDENLTVLAQGAIIKYPELGATADTLGAVKNYFAMLDLYEWLTTSAIAPLYDNYQKNPSLQHPFIQMILENHPQLINMGAFGIDRKIEKLLLNKMQWDEQHPTEPYTPDYVGPRTVYASKCLANSMMHSEYPRGAFTRTRFEEKQLARERPQAALPMPTFRRVIGFKILSPTYWADAIGTLVFENIAKGICWGINKLAGENKDAWWASGAKILLAGPFIAVKFLTYATAKLFSPSGIKEIARAITPRPPKIHPEIELPPISHSPSEQKFHIQTTDGLTTMTPIVPERKSTHAKVTRQLPSVAGPLPLPRVADLKVEDLVTEDVKTTSAGTRHDAKSVNNDSSGRSEIDKSDETVENDKSILPPRASFHK